MLVASTPQLLWSQRELRGRIRSIRSPAHVGRTLTAVQPQPEPLKEHQVSFLGIRDAFNE